MPKTRLRDLVRREPKPGIRLPGWLERLASVGIVSNDEQIIRRQRYVNVATFATAATALSHLIMNSVHDFHGLLIVNVDNVVTLTAALLIPRLHRFSENAGGIALVNALGNLSSVVNPAAIGVIKQKTGDFNGGLLWLAAMSVVAMIALTIILAVWRPTRRAVVPTTKQEA